MQDVRDGRGGPRPLLRAALRSALRAAALASVILAASCSHDPQRPGLPLPQDERRPYLVYRGQPARMTVLWQLADGGESTLEWGSAPGDYSLGSRLVLPDPDSGLSTYTLDGLGAGTRYHYRVVSDSGAWTGTFRTAPAGAGTPVRLVLYGDSRSQPGIHDRVAEAALAELAAREAVDDRPSLVLHTGDIVSDGDRLEDWSADLFDPSRLHVRNLLASRPFQVARGNHEGSAALLGAYFPYQGAGAHYYSFDFGPVHVAVLDQYLTGAAWTAQLEWLAGDLSASTRPWKIALMHEPAWSAGGGHPDDPIAQADLHPLFLANGVAMAITGHNHYYARASVDGIVYLTTGGGGAPLHTPEAGRAGVQRTERAWHFCLLEADAGSLRLTAQDLDGAQIDSLTVSD